MQLFVVNLDADRARLRRFTAVMDYLHVPFERWAATPGTKLDAGRFGVEPLEPGVFVSGFRDWSRNEAACGVSHIRALRHIVTRMLPWTILMEDDGILKQTLPADDEAWDLPADADIVLLNERAALGTVRWAGRQFSYGDVTGGAGTEGYLVSLQGAQKLLRALYPLLGPLDFQMYSHFESVQAGDSSPYPWRLPRNPEAAEVQLKAYRIEPSLVMHSGDGSTIGGSRHPQARFYCKVLLDLDFEGTGETAPPCGYSAFSGSSRPARQVVPEVLEPLATGTLFWRGVDISHFDESMAFQASGNGDRVHLMAVLRDSGVNIVRVSAWVGDHTAFSTERVLRLARQAAGHGLQVCLVLHYSDTWADPARQQKPPAWEGRGVLELRNEIYRYTKDVLRAMCDQGTPPAIVQTGNEITRGMLWASIEEPPWLGGQLSAPAGRRHEKATARQWEIFAGMLGEAGRGVRDGMAASEECARIMVHLDTAVTPKRAIGWLQQVQQHGVDFDAIGLSFYPTWHRTATLTSLPSVGEISRYFPEKELIIAETAYPHRPYRDETRSYDDGDPPFTARGQQEYLEKALLTIRRLPNGTGLFWWGATFVNGSFGHCADRFRAQALFDCSGVSLPALRAFKAP